MLLPIAAEITETLPRRMYLRSERVAKLRIKTLEFGMRARIPNSEVQISDHGSTVCPERVAGERRGNRKSPERRLSARGCLGDHRFPTRRTRSSGSPLGVGSSNSCSRDKYSRSEIPGAGSR